MPYPKEITPEILDKLAHIPDEQIKKDIFDTVAEIATMGHEVEALRVSARSGSLEAVKMANFRLGAKQTGIAKRRAFVAWLQALLEARGEGE